MARFPIRHAAVIAGVAGIAALAGCSAAADATDTTQTSQDGGATTSETSSSESSSADSSSDGSTSDATSSASGEYVAGTYEAEGSYLNPQGSVQAVKVSLTIEADGTIDAVEVTSEATDGQSKQYQQQFIDGIAAEVVGVSIDDLSVDKVAGSSLTSQGFNAAVDEIRTEAQA